MKDKATGEALKSCTTLITEPNDFVAEVHVRSHCGCPGAIERTQPVLCSELYAITIT
jgi:hypothetical protein